MSKLEFTIKDNYNKEAKQDILSLANLVMDIYEELEGQIDTTNKKLKQ